ncbi:SDR family NAD(P)-dependent oxidoreductase [Paenibacillus amylolyticus]|nr:SDR family NAD(P)-dependent oxidoreductase [Paenibacillus amylolyticus]
MTTIAGQMLASKVVMITGAGRGIGAEAAKLFVQQGASVMLVARTESELRKVRDEIVTLGGDAAYFTADLSDASNVEEAVKATVERYGRLDAAFNNAGVGLLYHRWWMKEKKTSI